MIYLVSESEIMKLEKEIQREEKKLVQWAREYEVGEPTVSDAVYDRIALKVHRLNKKRKELLGEPLSEEDDLFTGSRYYRI